MDGEVAIPAGFFFEVDSQEPSPRRYPAAERSRKVCPALPGEVGPDELGGQVPFGPRGRKDRPDVIRELLPGDGESLECLAIAVLQCLHDRRRERLGRVDSRGERHGSGEMCGGTRERGYTEADDAGEDDALHACELMVNAGPTESDRQC